MKDRTEAPRVGQLARQERAGGPVRLQVDKPAARGAGVGQEEFMLVVGIHAILSGLASRTSTKSMNAPAGRGTPPKKLPIWAALFGQYKRSYFTPSEFLPSKERPDHVELAK